MKKSVIHIFIILFITISAIGQNKKIIYSDKAPKPIGPYSQAVLSDNTLYVSGQIPINPLTNNIDTSSIEKETQLVMENIKAILEQSGMTFKNIVKTTIYTTKMNKFTNINDVYSSFFDNEFPARETIGVAVLPKNVHVEISIIAVKK
jgi:2-iminobutanoate/2-iminopropanoate deaminase